MSERGDVPSVDVDTAKDLLSSGHHFLDVRTTKEFNESHVRGALNVPYLFITQDGNVSRKQFVVSDFLAILPGRVKNPEFLTHVASVCNKEDHIIVKLKWKDFMSWKQGYEHVTNMEGGYSAWIDKELSGDK